MEKLFENLSFLFGSLGACAIILTLFLVIRGLLIFFNENEKDKQIACLKREIKELNTCLETKTELERLRYLHEKRYNK